MYYLELLQKFWDFNKNALIGGVFQNLDMISFGPTIRNPHSPDEMVNIATVQKFWDYLVETLKNVPKK